MIAHGLTSGAKCNTRQESHVAIHTNNYGDLLFIYKDRRIDTLESNT
jgi:hypothetical protein